MPTQAKQKKPCHVTWSRLNDYSEKLVPVHNKEASDLSATFSNYTHRHVWTSPYSYRVLVIQAHARYGVEHMCYRGATEIQTKALSKRHKSSILNRGFVWTYIFRKNTLLAWGRCRMTDAGCIWRYYKAAVKTQSMPIGKGCDCRCRDVLREIRYRQLNCSALPCSDILHALKYDRVIECTASYTQRS